MHLSHSEGSQRLPANTARQPTCICRQSAMPARLEVSPELNDAASAQLGLA
jgi:hypothetical protein